MSNIHPVSQELIDGPVVFVELRRVKWLGDGLRTRAATPSGLSRFASSCQHRIDYRGAL